MDAGKLRHRVHLQASEGLQDSVGQPDADWVTVATVWASVEPLNGREYFTSQQIVSEVTTRIMMRYQPLLNIPAVNERMRIAFQGKNYDIKDVIDVDMLHRTHVLMCGTGVVTYDNA